MMQTQTQQHIPEPKPNQQSGGLLYINHQIEPIMTLDELAKLIIYLGQIYRYAVNNNVQSVMIRK
jgi:hypothetical protein